jgi:hypothetical protein
VLLHLNVSTVLRGRWNLDMQLPPHYPRRIQSPPSFQLYYREAEGELSTCRV